MVSQWLRTPALYLTRYLMFYLHLCLGKTGVGFEGLTAVVVKSSVFWDITLCSPLKVNRRFGGTCHVHLQCWRISQARNQCEAGGKQNSRLAEISDYVGNRKEMKDSKPIPIVLPVGQNEPPIPIGCPTQPSRPIGGKNRITSMALKRGSCAGLGKDRGEVRMWWAENGGVWERRRVRGS
jgi:hypothetical protein